MFPDQSSMLLVINCSAILSVCENSSYVNDKEYMKRIIGKEQDFVNGLDSENYFIWNWMRNVAVKCELISIIVLILIYTQKLPHVKITKHVINDYTIMI